MEKGDKRNKTSENREIAAIKLRAESWQALENQHHKGKVEEIH